MLFRSPPRTPIALLAVFLLVAAPAASGEGDDDLEPCGPSSGRAEGVVEILTRDSDESAPCDTRPEAERRQAAPWESTIAPGDRVPEFEAEKLDGERRTVTYASGDTVLLFFLSACPTCHEMIPEWNQAYQERSGSLEVVGVMLDQEPPDFFASMPVEFPVVRAAHHLWSKHGVRKVPVTIRVDADGVVTHAVRGRVDAAAIAPFFTE